MLEAEPAQLAGRLLPARRQAAHSALFAHGLGQRVLVTIPGLHNRAAPDGWFAANWPPFRLVFAAHRIANEIGEWSDARAGSRFARIPELPGLLVFFGRRDL